MNQQHWEKCLQDDLSFKDVSILHCSDLVTLGHSGCKWELISFRKSLRGDESEDLILSYLDTPQLIKEGNYYVFWDVTSSEALLINIKGLVLQRCLKT